MFAAAAALPGCITQQVRYEPPADFPPSIESQPTAAHRLNEVVRYEDIVSEMDAGMVTALPLEIEIRDPNVDQELRRRLYVDFVPGDFFLESIVPPNGELARNVTVEVPLGQLQDPGCHRVEIFVSEQFASTREPVEEGNLATATWWVATPAMPGSTVDMLTCPE
jgi:hypothetical protein